MHRWGDRGGPVMKMMVRGGERGCWLIVALGDGHDNGHWSEGVI